MGHMAEHDSEMKNSCVFISNERSSIYHTVVSQQIYQAK